MSRRPSHQELSWPPAPDDLTLLDLGSETLSASARLPDPSVGPPDADRTQGRDREAVAASPRMSETPEAVGLPRVRRLTTLLPDRKPLGRHGALVLLGIGLLAALALAAVWLVPVGPTTSSADSGAPAGTPAPVSPAIPEPPASTTGSLGSLAVRTEPAGAIVIVDGKRLGASPVTVPVIEPGDHSVVIQHAGRTFRQAVRLAAGETVSLVVPLSPAPAPAATPVVAEGSIQVRAPFELRVTQQGRLLGTSEMERIPLDAGTHTIQLTSEVAGYQVGRTVRVSAGRTTIVEVEAPEERVAINAIPWAEVTIDGRPVGQTPLGALTVPIGPHVVVLRHPRFGEKTIRTTVRAGEPARISVDMRQ